MSPASHLLLFTPWPQPGDPSPTKQTEPFLTVSFTAVLFPGSTLQPKLPETVKTVPRLWHRMYHRAKAAV